MRAGLTPQEENDLARIHEVLATFKPSKTLKKPKPSTDAEKLGNYDDAVQTLMHTHSYVWNAVHMLKSSEWQNRYPDATERIDEISDVLLGGLFSQMPSMQGLALSVYAMILEARSP